MKIKKGFKLRTVMGKSVVVPEGVEAKNFNKIISLNESAALLWNAFANKTFDANDMADALVQEYGIEHDLALSDVQEMLDQWLHVGLIEA